MKLETSELKMCRLCKHAFREHNCPTCVAGTVPWELKEENHLEKARPRKLPKLLTPEQKLRARWCAVKMRARRKNVDFNLSETDIQIIIDSTCVYCFAPAPSSIDRKVPKEGYTVTNCVAACRRCNTVKNDTVSYEDMIALVKFLNW